MEHYVASPHLTSERLHRYNQFGYWLASFSFPQRMFTPSMITSFTESCAQATLVENCFSNLGNKYSTLQGISVNKLRSSAKSIWSVLYPLGKQMLQVFSLRLYRSSYIEDEVRRTLLSWIPPKVTILHEGQRRKFFRQNLLQRTSIRKCLDQISLSYA